MEVTLSVRRRCSTFRMRKLRVCLGSLFGKQHKLAAEPANVAWFRLRLSGERWWGEAFRRAGLSDETFETLGAISLASGKQATFPGSLDGSRGFTRATCKVSDKK